MGKDYPDTREEQGYFDEAWDGVDQIRDETGPVYCSQECLDEHNEEEK